MHPVCIVAAGRTPIGSFNGALASLSAVELGTQLVQPLLAGHDIAAAQVDELILGHVLTAGCGQNTARQVALGAGLPHSTPAFTLNKVCGSGMKAVQLAAQAIALGDARLIVAGGMESMSQAAHVLPGSRRGMKMGHWQLVDTLLQDGLQDAFGNGHMGMTAENLATRFAISREEQDAFALASQRKALAAQAAGHFESQIFPVRIPQRHGEPVSVAVDEGPRQDTSLEVLARLRPAFIPAGSVTAGNASGLNDGAAALVLCNEQTAQALNLPVLARIKACAAAGVDPAFMGIGPVPATRACLSKAGWRLEDLDLIEANEAFAVQALAVGRELGWDSGRVNVNGGAIALGHPIGASGARVLVTLLHEMLRRDSRKGLATLCIGGGQGIAVALER
jgi:acetyl-CoA C-acetyltransferase